MNEERMMTPESKRLEQIQKLAAVVDIDISSMDPEDALNSVIDKINELREMTDGDDMNLEEAA